MHNFYLDVKDINRELFDFYEYRYDILDFKLLNYTDFFYLGSVEQKICRFCGKSEPEVTFEKIAHALPESTGNHFLVSYYECDKCNKLFARQLENEYANFFNFYHNATNISGKKGVPIYQSKGGKSKAIWKSVDGSDKIFVMNDTTDDITTTFNAETKKLIRTGTIPSYIPIAVFKCFVKMAISVMPEAEVNNFVRTISWIMEKRHANFYSDEKKLLVRYKMIPGFNVTKYPCCILYKRKPNIWQGPYMLFNLTYGCFSYLIEVPTLKDASYHHIMNVPFPPIPFNTSSEDIFDLTSCERQKTAIQSIEYEFGDINEITEQMKDVTAESL